MNTRAKRNKPVITKDISVDTGSKQSPRQLGLLCSLIALLLYANTLTHDYTVDDGTVMENNSFTKEGISAIPKIFSTSYRAGFWDRNDGLYRPLSVAMFALEWQLAPRQPWLGHLVNVMLYALTAWLLYILLLELLKKHHPLIPFFITLLFVVHPVHTEVIANIKSRDEILCFLFAILSMKQFMGWLSTKKFVYLITGIVSFMLALFSKENAITLIAVFPLIGYYFSDANRKELMTITMSALIAGVFFMCVRYVVIGGITGVGQIQLVNNSLVGTPDKMIQLGTALYIMGKYLLLLVFPKSLVFDYSFNTIPLVAFFSFQSLIVLLVFCFLIFYAIKEMKRKNAVSFGILFFLITISLVSNIAFLIESTMAERFLYMPSLGFCVAVVAGLNLLFPFKENKQQHFSKQIKSTPVYLVLLLVGVVFSVRTVARNADWKDNLTLLSHDVKLSPNSARIRYAYGSAILIEQALKEENKERKKNLLYSAINELEKGVAIIEDYADAWYHLAIAYKEAEDAQNAVRCFEKVLSYRPFKDAEGYVACGLAYGMNKQYDKAIEKLNYAWQLDPSSAEAMNNLGLYYCEAGKLNESKLVLDKLIKLKPDFNKAYYNLGNTYAKATDYKSAITYYRKAIALDGFYGDAYNNIGNCYAMMTNRDSAHFYYQKTVEIDPSNVKAIINLGITYSQVGDTVSANKWFAQARSMGANI